MPSDPITISARRLSTGTVAWDVLQSGRCADWLCWDELVTALAYALLNGSSSLLSPGVSIPDQDPEVYRLTLVETAPSNWTVQHSDGHVRDELMPGEALGFVAAFTLDGRALFSGWRRLAPALLTAGAPHG